MCKLNLSIVLSQFIGGDPDKDVAVLQLQCPEEKQKELVPITVGTSANLLVGQKVFALGNPFGLDHSMTQVLPLLQLALALLRLLALRLPAVLQAQRSACAASLLHVQHL